MKYDYTFEELFTKIEEFGDHGQQTVSIPGRKVVILVHTGNTSEENVKLFGGTRGFAFSVPTAMTFAEEGEEPLDVSHGLYLSQDGTDPNAGKPFGRNGRTIAARENAALKPNTDYYWTLEVTAQGHSSWVPKIAATYSGTDTPEDYEVFPTFEGGIDMTIEGVEGMWVPNA